MNLKDKIWDALFLDFYLDKHWTWRFKLMNLISGDLLRPALCALNQHAEKMELADDAISARRNYMHIKRVKRWCNVLMEEYLK